MAVTMTMFTCIDLKSCLRGGKRGGGMMSGQCQLHVLIDGPSLALRSAQ
jgi:hypothetical protein